MNHVSLHYNANSSEQLVPAEAVRLAADLFLEWIMTQTDGPPLACLIDTDMPHATSV